MNEHIEVIINCHKKFPEMRFGQFLFNAMDMMDSHGINRLFYIPDRDLAEHCKTYCKERGR